MTLKNSIIAGILLVLIGYATGRYLQPAQIETQIKEVIKEVEVVKKDTVTVVHEVKRPDGTVEIDTRTEDKSVITTQTDKKTEQQSIITNIKPQWKASGLAAVDFNNDRRLTYGISVERRLLGPVFVGVQGYDNKMIGISVGLEF
jgi:hypothetical protein